MMMGSRAKRKSIKLIRLELMRYMKWLLHSKILDSTADLDIYIDRDNWIHLIGSDEGHILDDTWHKVSERIQNCTGSTYVFDQDDDQRDKFSVLLKMGREGQLDNVQGGWCLCEVNGTGLLRVCGESEEHAACLIESILSVVMKQKRPLDPKEMHSLRSLDGFKEGFDNLVRDLTSKYSVLDIRLDETSECVQISGVTKTVGIALSRINDYFSTRCIIKGSFYFPNENVAKVLRMNVDMLRADHHSTEFRFVINEKHSICHFTTAEDVDVVTEVLKTACENVMSRLHREHDSAYLTWFLSSEEGKDKVQEIRKQLRVFINSKRMLDAMAFKRALRCIKLHVGPVYTSGAELMVSSDHACKSELEANFKYKINPGVNILSGGRHIIYQLLEKPRMNDWRERWRQTIEEHVTDVFKSSSSVSSICFPPIGLNESFAPPKTVVEALLVAILKLLAMRLKCHQVSPDIVVHVTAGSYAQTFQEVLHQLLADCESNEAFLFYGLTERSVKEAIKRYEDFKKEAFVIHDFSSTQFKGGIKMLSPDKVMEFRRKAAEAKANLVIDQSMQMMTLSGPAESSAELVNDIEAELDKLTAAFRNLKVPDCWVPVDSPEPQLYPLDPLSPEYQRVEQLLKASSSGLTVTILKISRIQNPILYNQYDLYKLAIGNQLNMSTMNPTTLERELWHGTSLSSSKEIYSGHFNRSYAGKNAAAYGNGCYFAVNSAYSLQHTYSPPDTTGTRCLILASVVTGRFTAGTATMSTLPAGFHSAVDNQNNPTMFIVFNDNAAYPKYQILFK